MPQILPPAEASAMRATLTSKLGSGAGTTALIKLLDAVNGDPDPPVTELPEATPAEEDVPAPAEQKVE